MGGCRRSRPRFDEEFAAAVGEVAYDDPLDGLEVIAASMPKTARTVIVKRALRALGNPPKGLIGHPLVGWRTPPEGDLTAQVLKVVHDVVIGPDAPT